MTTTADTDPVLESLLDELRAVMTAANELNQPVYPASPTRIAELEHRADELRVAIQVRRRELPAR